MRAYQPGSRGSMIFHSFFVNDYLLIDKVTIRDIGSVWIEGIRGKEMKEFYFPYLDINF